jgi:hypothetical protein
MTFFAASVERTKTFEEEGGVVVHVERDGIGAGHDDELLQ